MNKSALHSLISTPLTDFNFSPLISSHHAAIYRSPLAINFLKYRAGTKIRVPLKYTNMDDCVDIKRGYFCLFVITFFSLSLCLALFKSRFFCL